MNWNIRPATSDDAKTLFDLIYQLAIYEKLEDEVVSTHKCIAEAIDSGHAAALLAESEEAEAGTKQAVAFALYFYKFSTFTGTSVLHLEDLFVLPSLRGKGIGKALLLQVAQVARDQNCARMEWHVLDWNQPAIDFYESLGTHIHRDWLLARLDKDGLAKVEKM
jgi:GNAT superfamily N-acetyltransferase